MGSSTHCWKQHTFDFWYPPVIHMEVSKNGGYPQIIHFHGIFHFIPSILGYLHLWNPPYNAMNRIPSLNLQSRSPHMFETARSSCVISPSYPHWIHGGISSPIHLVTGQGMYNLASQRRRIVKESRDQLPLTCDVTIGFSGSRVVHRHQQPLFNGGLLWFNGALRKINAHRG